MNRLISINEVSKRLGVSISTLRRWDKAGVLVAERTPKGHRRYDLSKLDQRLLQDNSKSSYLTLQLATLQRQLDQLQKTLDEINKQL